MGLLRSRISGAWTTLPFAWRIPIGDEDGGISCREVYYSDVMELAPSSMGGTPAHDGILVPFGAMIWSRTEESVTCIARMVAEVRQNTAIATEESTRADVATLTCLESEQGA